MIDIKTGLPKLADITSKATTSTGGLLGSAAVGSRSVSSIGKAVSPLMSILPSLFDAGSTLSQDDAEENAVMSGAVGDDTRRVANNARKQEQKTGRVLGDAASIALSMLLLCL